MKRILFLASFTFLGMIGKTEGQTMSSLGNDPRYEMFGLQQDKQRHAAIGGCVAGMTYIVAYDHFRARDRKTAHMKSTAVTMAAVAGMALIKEMSDYRKHQVARTWNATAASDMRGDLLATLLGGATVTLVIRIGYGQ